MINLSERSHYLRAALSDEMHVRRLPRFSPPARLMQIVTLLGEEAASAARNHFDGIARRFRHNVSPEAKYALVEMGDTLLVWERHTEFASFTFVREGAFDDPFDPSLFDDVAAPVLEGMPGRVIRATQIAVGGTDMAEPDAATLAQWFAPEALIICDVTEGSARVISDFRLHRDGYGRLLLLDRGLVGDEAAQTVLRLQELGNYRNMALLGLPLAQTLTPDVSRLEQRLATLTREVSERGSEDDKLLDELTFLSGELARMLAETRYRMSATRAYAQLSEDRLHSLGVQRLRGYQTLIDFTERRLIPAMRTCDSFSARLNDLSQRAAWTSSLLRTRIDIALAKQNRDLLTSMDKRTKAQLRLQQTVEGLSVVAISYYAVALLSYVLHAVPGIDKAVATAIAVPVVLAIGMISVRRLRAHFAEH